MLIIVADKLLLVAARWLVTPDVVMPLPSDRIAPARYL